MGHKQGSSKTAADGIDRREMLRRLAAGALLPLAGACATAGAAMGDVSCSASPELPLFNPRQRSGMQVANLVPPIVDPITDLKAAISIGLGAIPTIGGALAVIFGLLWPVDATDVWDKIKDKVQQMINQAIDQVVLTGLQTQIAGMKSVLSSHLLCIKAVADHPGDPQVLQDLIASARSAQDLFLQAAPFFELDGNPGWKGRILPLFAQFANLHLSFLQDIVANGRQKYGFSAGLVATYSTEFDQRVDHCIRHVDATLPGANSDIENKYQQERSKYQVADGFHDLDYIATGTWHGRQDANRAANDLVVYVKDYRDLWPSMKTSGGARPVLDRELWYGPYGAPSVRDIGHADWAEYQHYGRTGGMPDVATPAASPSARVRFISVGSVDLKRDNKMELWRFPRTIDLYRDGDGRTPPANQFGLSLAGQWGGEVVGVKVDSGRYLSRTASPWSNMPTTGAYLVSALYFRQRDGGTHVVGSDVVGKEMKSYGGEDVPVPDAHCLSGVSVPSTVRQLYQNIDHGDRDSIGSILFGFRLIDPQLRPTPRLLGTFFVTSPQAVDGADLVALHAQLAEDAGSALPPSQQAALLAELSDHIDLFDLDDARAFFWSTLEKWSIEPAAP